MLVLHFYQILLFIIMLFYPALIVLNLKIQIKTYFTQIFINILATYESVDV